MPRYFAGGADPERIFAIVELTQNSNLISRNLHFFAETSQIRLQPAKISTELRKTTGGYALRLSSPVLARHVYIQTADLDAALSDNYFDLLPGEPAEIQIKSNASEEQMKAALNVISLTDAFAPEAFAQVTSPSSAGSGGKP